MKTVIFSLALTVGATTTTAQEARNCAPHDAAVDRLTSQWGEVRRMIGITDNGQAIVEMFANAETGTWTLAVTNAAAEGELITCLAASGQAFEALAEDRSPSGDPA